MVHVFDVSQTEGRELASFASLAGDPGDWLPRLEGLVASHGIRLEYPEVVLQNANGASFGGLIHVSSRLPMAQKLSTLAHELAHELLHQGADQRPSSKAVLETEAEAVAWVVCRACGLDCSTRAADDIQMWDGDEQTLLQSLERGPQRRHSTCYS
ncbi:MAG: ImmA/IrrE family metallo-endopeptidase, partial [Planctomyces sp.]